MTNGSCMRSQSDSPDTEFRGVGWFPGSLGRYMTPGRWALLALVLFEIGWLLFPPHHVLVEQWYSLGFYPVVSSVIVPVQNALPVPITAILIVGTCLALCAWMWRAGRGLRAAGRSPWGILPRLLGVAAWGVALFLLGFLVLWGAGYQRTPVAERWALDGANLTAEEAARLQGELLAVIQENVEELDGRSRAGAVQAIAVSMERLLHGQGDGAVRVPRQVRATPPGLFLAFSTAGMCVPPAIEPFADGAYDDISFVQVAAHELAHVAGYNRESEATLIGYLAGLASDDPLARYAVALDIYADLCRRIPEEEARTAAWEALPARARDDLQTRRAIGDRYRIKIALFQRVGYHVYDGYLKSQGIEDGMANYSAGLRLFAGAWRAGLAILAPRLEIAS